MGQGWATVVSTADVLVRDNGRAGERVRERESETAIRQQDDREKAREGRGQEGERV